MTRIWKWVVFGIAIILLGWGLYSLIASKNELQRDIPGLEAKMLDLKKENQDLSDQNEFYKSEVNEVKKLEEQTSYRPSDQKLIIITSGATSTLSTSTATSSIK